MNVKVVIHFQLILRIQMRRSYDIGRCNVWMVLLYRDHNISTFPPDDGFWIGTFGDSASRIPPAPDDDAPDLMAVEGTHKFLVILSYFFS